jgi:hypothetical protein
MPQRLSGTGSGYGSVGVWPAMDTNIQVGPTGKKLLPLTVKTDVGEALASGE